MEYIKLIAPAKVNLVLAVGEKLDNGYHHVDTIMHALSIHDTLEMRRFEKDEGGLLVDVIVNSTEGVVVNNLEIKDNLVYKAIVCLAEILGRDVSEEIQVVLSKAIPLESGLGGGSSDAAAALLGISAMWGLQKDDPRIYEAAFKLGKDVPFFLHRGCAYLSGEGDQFVHSLVPRNEFCVIIRPKGGISTSGAYAGFDENPDYVSQRQLEEIKHATDAAQVKCCNNLEEVAIKILPEINNIFSWIKTQSGFKDFVLCGSGSAVLVIANSYSDALNLSIGAKKSKWSSRVTSFSKLGSEVLEKY